MNRGTMIKRLLADDEAPSSYTPPAATPVGAYVAKPPPTSARYASARAALRRWNIAAFILHTLSFLAAIVVTIIFLSDTAQVGLTTDFTVYDANATISTGGTAPDAAGPFSQTLKVLGFYQLVWVIEFEPLFTALFHGIIAFAPAVNEAYTRNALIKGQNPLRWWEYAFSSTAMLWVVAQLSGVTNILMLVLLALSNVALQFQGFIMEKLNPEKRLARGKRVHWSPTVVGWVLFMAQWIVIFTYFFSAITSDRPPTAESVPAFVYVTVFGLLVQFSLFGVVMTAHYAGWPKWFTSTYNNEVAYIILSFISKFFLTWVFLIGIITNGRA